jgi:hypothetical protein
LLPLGFSSQTIHCLGNVNLLPPNKASYSDTHADHFKFEFCRVIALRDGGMRTVRDGKEIHKA